MERDLHPCWDGSKWVQVEDHRGRTGWLDGLETVIDQLGPLPEGFSGQAPANPAAELDAELARVEAELAALDQRYLPPRVLANLSRGDEYALSQYERHEEEAAPLRKKWAELSLLAKGDFKAEDEQGKL